MPLHVLIFRVKRGFQPAQRTQRKERKERKKMMKWRHYWIGQSQPPATTALCRWQAAKLWQTHVIMIKYKIIEIKFNLHHKLHNMLKRTEISICTIDSFFNF